MRVATKRRTTVYAYTVTGTKWTFVYKEVTIVRMYSSQTDQNIIQILLFLDNLLMIYQAFGVNLRLNNRCMFVARGACTSIRYCAYIRT